MRLRQAQQHEIDSDKSLIYQTHEMNSFVEVSIVGFIPIRSLDCKDTTLCVLEKWDGTIILATDNQLFVKMG